MQLSKLGRRARPRCLPSCSRMCERSRPLLADQGGACLTRLQPIPLRSCSWLWEVCLCLGPPSAAASCADASSVLLAACCQLCGAEELAGLPEAVLMWIGSSAGGCWCSPVTLLVCRWLCLERRCSGAYLP